MKATVFLHNEDSEPVVLDLDFESGLHPDGKSYTAREVLDDLFGSVSPHDIDIVSEQALNIAMHAMHGALNALGAVPYETPEARAWLAAGLRELAFYDRDGIEIEGDFGEEIDGHEGPRAADPGRPPLSGYVPWPEVDQQGQKDAPSDG